MDYFKKAGEAVVRHRAIIVTAAIAIVLTLAAVYLLIMPSRTGLAPETVGFDRALTEPERAALSPDQPAGLTEIEVKEGRLEVKSQDAEKELQDLWDLAKDYEGYLEQGQRRETDSFLRITAVIRVPVKDFENFVEIIRERLDVRSYEIKNFRIGIQRQLDELDIIRRALEDYDEMRSRALAMEVGERQVELLMSITNKEMELISRQRMFERELAGRENRADLSTLTVVFEQKLRPSVWPESFADRFFERIRQAVRSVSEAVAGVVANSLILIVRIIEYAVYIIIAVLPLMFVWRLLRQIYKRWAK